MQYVRLIRSLAATPLSAAATGTGGATMARRWPLYVAIAYAVVVLVALFVVPAAPEVTASGEKLVRYYQDHGDGVRVGTWLATISPIPFVLLVAWLRSRLSGIGRDVLLLGAVGYVVPAVVWTWMSAGLALHAQNLDPHVARTVSDVRAYFGPVLTVSVILLIAPVGIAAWRGIGGFPRWIAWITGVLVIEQAIETITVFGKSGFIAPGGPMNFVLGAGLFVVWVIAAGATSNNA